MKNRLFLCYGLLLAGAVTLPAHAMSPDLLAAIRAKKSGGDPAPAPTDPRGAPAKKAGPPPPPAGLAATLKTPGASVAPTPQPAPTLAPSDAALSPKLMHLAEALHELKTKVGTTPGSTGVKPAPAPKPSEIKLPEIPAGLAGVTLTTIQQIHGNLEALQKTYSQVKSGQLVQIFANIKSGKIADFKNVGKASTFVSQACAVFNALRVQNGQDPINCP